MSTYTKPDVEVYQQFQQPTADIRPAILQSCIVGPLYQIFTDEVVGTYDNEEHSYYFPHDLKPGAIISEDGLEVRVVKYGEEFVVSKSDLVAVGLDGKVLTGALNEFVDNSKDFLDMNITTHTDAESNDGDYLRIPAGANAGYHKILEVVDSHTLVLAEDLLEAEDENYEIRSTGYIVESEVIGFSLRITPGMGFSGDVTVTFKALRTDRQTPFEWTRTDLENEVGVDQITPENPLAYGASLTLSVLGSRHFTMAMPIANETLEGYISAIEKLINHEVYGITCLTHNPQVAQALQAHVNKMSDPLEKMERIAIINTGYMEEIIKVGHIDVSDGATSHSGIDSTETVLTESAALACDGNAQEYTFTGNNPTRVSFHFDNIAKNIVAGATVEYELASNVGTWVNVASDSDQYHVIVKAPANDSITKVRYTSSGVIEGFVNIFGLNTDSEAEYTEYDYMRVVGQITNIEPVTEYITVSASDITAKRSLLADKPLNPEIVKLSISEIQNFNQGDDFIVIEDSGSWYISWDGKNLEDVIAQGHTLKVSYVKGDSITQVTSPTAGHQAIKVRAWDVTPSAVAEKPETWAFPKGMSLNVITESEVRVITNPGTYVFDRDILAMYKTVSVDADVDSSVTDLLVELMVLPEAGSYSRNKFVDSDAEFITSSKVSAGDVLKIKTGACAGDYTILNVASNTEVLVDAQFGIFEEGLDYQIVQGEVTKSELASWISSISSSFADRRVTNIYCPFVGRSPDGVNIEVLPGYYYNCIIAGLVQAIAPQAGLTNMALPGFTQVFKVSDAFISSQLDEIANGGTFIIMQNDKWTVPYVRHQLTTDRSILEKQELSCVKDLDYISKMGRETMRPYIGRFLVNEITMTTLYTIGDSFCKRLRKDKLANKAELISIKVDPNSRDTVIMCIDVEVPVPLNKIRLYIYV